MDIDIKNQYYDMVAISLVTDMCNMTSLEIMLYLNTELII